MKKKNEVGNDLQGILDTNILIEEWGFFNTGNSIAFFFRSLCCSKQKKINIRSLTDFFVLSSLLFSSFFSPLFEKLFLFVSVNNRNNATDVFDNGKTDSKGQGPQLNGGCGAEWVQKKRLPPANTNAETDVGVRFASFDGDADRVVYFTFMKENNRGFTLLDGDKIAVLTAQFVGEELQAAGLTDAINMGIVQTAYANGAAHKAVLSEGIECPYAKTGKKEKTKTSGKSVK